MKFFEIKGLANGPMIGFQYLPQEEIEDDWTELNIYLLIICLRFVF